MAYPYWPESLPKCILADGFSNSGQMPVQRQQMESGADRVTRISSTTVRENNISFLCNKDQLAEFWSFYENEAGAGSSWVFIPMYTANATILHLARFISFPSMSRYGLDWRVTFSLETTQQQFDWS